MKAKDRLVEDLREANAPAWMVEKAFDGVYDDFGSPLATPITELIKDCDECGLNEMAVRARRGRYDSSPEEVWEWLELERRKFPRCHE